ncbi:MAG TPA: hypothetical protein VGG98_07440 [Solirubrobacteraceae bacterium]
MVPPARQPPSENPRQSPAAKTDAVPDRGHRRHGDEPRRESFGGVELERHVKADGRALILYVRRPDTELRAHDPQMDSATGDRPSEDQPA